MNLPDIFHPIVRKWFQLEVGVPTDIQMKTWPAAAEGKHLLITAPTGCGKTLAAFLWSINQLITGNWAGGSVNVLYISPLKALNNDIQKNLVGPVNSLRKLFSESEENFPDINILTRSGDTPESIRRKMIKTPPEILITTPESLNLILSSARSRQMLKDVRLVIMDEIHSILGVKRGTHMITAVDRLVEIAGEFQRIALSATVSPLEVAAEFAGGLKITATGDEPLYRKRDVEIVISGMKKDISVDVDFPSGARENLVNDSWWPSLVNEFRNIINSSSSTLFFTNSRKLAEKVTRLINEDYEEPLVYSHHGSLSREIRLLVEEKLKKGELKGIVATSSLELGIDIGNLDRVVLVQAPFSISSALQRIGRSGHSVGAGSRGTIFPTHGRDFIDAAVIARAVSESDIEEIYPVETPLDVLAQVIVSMAVSGEQELDGVFYMLRSSYPFRNLARQQYDLVINMLAGRYADTRIRELEPRISLDMISHRFKAGKGAGMLIYMSGGTIPDRGYFQLRHRDSGARIGELDEEFTWERSIGDRFTLGVQNWQITGITSNDVEVIPYMGNQGMIPFWKAEGVNRDFHFAEKVGLFLKLAGERLDDPDFREQLLSDYHMQETAADEAIGFLRAQVKVSGTGLPHRNNIVIEHFDDPGNRSDSKQVIIHTIWGGRVNWPFSLALSAAWEDVYGYRLEIISNNDSILLMLPHSFSAGDIFGMVTEDKLEQLLRKKLESTGLFGARFRMNAGTALLLPRGGFRKRLPLWLNRLRSKKLMDAVKNYRDFPILLETWRTCLRDEFDLGNLVLLLDEIRDGRIQITETVTGRPSPFAGDLIWRQVDRYMYQDDTPFSENASDLSGELIRKIIRSDHLRPKISSELGSIFEKKLKRTGEGYSPSSVDELIDHVKERLLVPLDDWERLLSAIDRDHGELQGIGNGMLPRRIVLVGLPGARQFSAAAIERLPYILGALDLDRGEVKIQCTCRDESDIHSEVDKLVDKVFSNFGSDTGVSEKAAGEEIILQWLSFYGPIAVGLIKDVFGMGDDMILPIIHSLLDDSLIVEGEISDPGTGEEICHADNLEILIRMSRRERQPQFEARELTSLQLFIASYQGVTGIIPGDDGYDILPAPGTRFTDKLQAVLEKLFGYPASASSWEEHILPARIFPYNTAWLDSLLQNSGLTWFGCSGKKTGFSLAGDLELFLEKGESLENNTRGISLLPDSIGRYSFFDIMKITGMGSRETTEAVWDSVWRSEISCDSFDVVRRGLLNRFEPFAQDKNKTGRRSGLSRWKASNPAPGNWYSLGGETAERDLLEEDEINRDRVRQLLARYGILFRELLAYETEPMRWGRLFRTLRLMELSGEIISGHFFKGISGLQFISPGEFRFLNDLRNDGRIFWLNAADPASLCGVKLDGLKSYLPSRLSSTFMVFHGEKLVITAFKNCRFMDITVAPDDNNISDYLEFLKILLTRDFNPLKTITVETINGIPAIKSEYAEKFYDFGFTGDYRSLELRRSYHN